MPGHLVEVMGFDPRAVEHRARFFEGYAARLEEAEALTPRRGEGREAEPDPWHSLVEPVEPWMADARIGTAYRFAAQWASLLNPRWARALAMKAAMRYDAAGSAYGCFLVSSFASPDEGSEFLLAHVEHARRMAGMEERAERIAPPGSLWPAAGHHATQQTYLVVAMVGHDEAFSASEGALSAMQRGLELHASQPIGPAGAPIGMYLELARDLLKVRDERSPGAQWRATQILAELARMYEASLVRARENRHLWERMQAPVDVVDLDVAGLAALVDRVTRASMGVSLAEAAGALVELSEMSRAPIDVALDIAEDALGPEGPGSEPAG